MSSNNLLKEMGYKGGRGSGRHKEELTSPHGGKFQHEVDAVQPKGK